MSKVSVKMLLLALLLASSSYCSAVLAWGVEGHKIVALIAESQLTPTARQQIDEILDRQENGRISDIASWADQIRGKEHGSQISHLVKVPFDAQGYSEKRDCRGKYRCVIFGIKHYERLLSERKNEEANQRERALKFLVHYIGDIHQPLHGIAQTGAMRVHGAPSQWDLHKIWDTVIIRRQNTSPEAIAKSLLARPHEVVQGTPETWAMESHDIARNIIYSGDAGLSRAKSAVHLDRRYYIDNYPIVEDRLYAAGIRLGNVLNVIFK